MKKVLDHFYSINGTPNASMFKAFKTDLFTHGTTPGIVVDRAVTTGYTMSGAATTGVLISGTLSGSAILVSGNSSQGVYISGRSVYGVYISGLSTYASIYISNTSARALSIGTKGVSYAASGAIKISSTGGVLDTEPANNYLVGVFSKVSVSESTGSKDDLGSAWFRTQVNVGITIGASYSLYGVKSQLRIYATSGSATSISNWAAAGLLGVLEVSGE